MKQGFKTLKAYFADESGATAIEYALIAALIGVGIMVGLNMFGNQTDGSWRTIATEVDTAFQTSP